jgi:carboxylesterase type B
VLVFIHGGSWYLGHSTEYQPEYFLEHEVVLVTGNYRLGPMGFLSTEDEHCSGNFALKDQLMILEWVQMNIEKFNGDKRSVTLFGESAGAASVDYHLNSPMSRKLFHRAIVQSASMFNNWAQPDRKGVAKMKAIRLADKVNCTITGTTMKEMVDCLRQKSAHDIIDAQRHFQVMIKLITKFYQFD